MTIAKVSVEHIDKKEPILYDLKKCKKLDEIISEICHLFDQPQSSVYGLKLIYSTKSSYTDYYISEDNYKEIQNGDSLRLVYSVKHYVQRIFNHLKDEYKEQSFKDLRNLSVDPEFINEIVRSNEQTNLLEVFINGDLQPDEQVACLITVIHLLQKGYITATTPNFLDKTLSVLEHSGTATCEQLKYALSVLHKLLVSRNSVFNEWKEKIIRNVTIQQLSTYFSSSDLQYGTLLLMNTIIKCCKGEKRTHLIQELNKQRKVIYENIVSSGPVDANTEHELYVCQTYILSLLSPSLEVRINLDDRCLQKYILTADEVKRNTILMDFEENGTSQKNASLENLLETHVDSRFSLVSVSSKQSDDWDSTGDFYRRSELLDFDTATISYLTNEALDYYNRKYYNNYYQSQMEETFCEPGFLISSERIVSLLAKLLHVGRDPVKNSTFYQPIMFYISKFFFELFCRSMWLLSRTRREMKATTINDYHKVILVLEKQIFMALETKPRELKNLTELLSKNSYYVILDRWTAEKEEEMKKLINEHPCIKEIKMEISPQNENNIFKQRLNVAHKGEIFSTALENKTKITGRIFAKLYENRRQFIIQELNSSGTKCPPKTYNVDSITHMVVGKNCQHSAICDNPTKAFSIIIDNADKINFIAKDERTAAYWTDVFYLLIGKGEKSKYFLSELEELNNMDIRLRLLEVQNIPLPKKPPPIPQLPPERPKVPPRPVKLRYSVSKIT